MPEPPVDTPRHDHPAWMEPLHLLRAHGDAAALVSIAVAALIFLFLPIRFPSRVSTQGKVLPVRSWVLLRGTDGQLVSTYTDYLQGSVQNFTVAQFEQRDAIRFSLNDTLLREGRVHAGDVIGSLYSGFASRQLSRLAGSLAAERALLRSLVTGERISQVEEAERVLDRARIQEEQQRVVVERTRQLVGSGAVSRQELEMAESNLRVYGQNVLIAEAQLRSARTGVKEEQADLVRTRIRNLEEEISSLRMQARDQTVYTPISGSILKTPSIDTLLVVTDTTAHVVYIPVPLKHYRYVAVGQRARVETLRRGVFATGRIIRRDPFVHVLNGQQVMTVVTLIDSATVVDFYPGLQSACRIETGLVTPLQYLRRFAGYLFR